jgi:putative copper export protein
MTRRPGDVTSVPAAPPTPSFIRPALGLLAGLGIFVLAYAVPILIGTLVMLQGVSNPAAYQPPPGFQLFNLIVGALAGMASGWLVGRMTVGRSWYTLLLLALILCISPLAEARRAAASGQSYQLLVALAVVAPAGALLGGWVERRRTAGASARV